MYSFLMNRQFSVDVGAKVEIYKLIEELLEAGQGYCYCFVLSA